MTTANTQTMRQTTMTGLVLTGVLTSGTAVTVSTRNAPLPATVTVKPVAGDTVAVSFSADGGTSFDPWDLGSLTSASAVKSYVFYSGITHLRFQRTAGTGTTSTWSVSG